MWGVLSSNEQQTSQNKKRTNAGGYQDVLEDTLLQSTKDLKLW